MFRNPLFKLKTTTTTTINRLPSMFESASQREFNWFNHINLLTCLLHHITRKTERRKKLDPFEQSVGSFFFHWLSSNDVYCYSRSFSNKPNPIAEACACCMCFVRWHIYFGHGNHFWHKFLYLIRLVTHKIDIWHKLNMDLQFYNAFKSILQTTTSAVFCAFPSVVYFYTDFFPSRSHLNTLRLFISTFLN